jgi:hypothetical protein
MAKNRASKFRALYTNDYTPIFFTYYLVFPDGDTWCRQQEFQNHEANKEMMEYEINRTAFSIDVKQKLRHKKEADWKDHNGVEHRVVIESKLRDEKWGRQKR